MNAFKKFRKQHDYTQVELAKRLGMSVRTLSRLEQKETLPAHFELAIEKLESEVRDGED